MNLAEIKSHAQQIISVVNDLDQLDAQLHELTKEPLTGTEVNISISYQEPLTFSKAEIQSLMESKAETLGSRLRDLRKEIAE